MRKKRHLITRIWRNLYCFFLKNSRYCNPTHINGIPITTELKVVKVAKKNGIVQKKCPSKKKIVKSLTIRKINSTEVVQDNRTSEILRRMTPCLQGKKSITATELRNITPIEMWTMEWGKHKGKLLKDLPIKYIYKEAAKGTWKIHGNRWIEKGLKKLGKLPANGTKVTMPFGKHKGKLLVNIPKNYVKWLNDHDVFHRKPNKHLGQEFVRLGVIK